MIALNTSTPWENDSTTVGRGSGRAMNDFGTSNTEAKSRAWRSYRVTPVCVIFRVILLIAIGGLSSRVFASGDPSLLPSMDMTMKAGDEDCACIGILLIKGKAG